ncbi:MAG: MobA/MobL family protein [Rhodomicrobium sp.]
MTLAGAAGDNAAYNARENETRLENGNAHDFSDAARNVAYNAREEVTYAVRSHVIPPEPKEAEAWFREQEKGDRKNARMSDRFIGALPRELTPDQCIEAVEKFCREVTQDRVPWHFALHVELDKKNEPDWNPHAHIKAAAPSTTAGSSRPTKHASK